MERTTKLVGVGGDFRYAKDFHFEGGLDGLIRTLEQRLSHVQVIVFGDDRRLAEIRSLAPQLPLLHHLTGIEPASPKGIDLEAFAAQSRQSLLAGCPWQYEDIGYWTRGPYNAPYFAPPILERDVADHVAERVRELNARSPVPFLPENPTCTFVTGRLSLGQFFTRVAERSQSPCVLDVSHLYSFARCTDTDPDRALADYPLESVWELHVAGGRMDPTCAHRYLDTHTDPILDDVLELLPTVIARCPALKAITYEISPRIDAPTFFADLERLEAVVAKTGFSPRIASSTAARSAS